MRKNITTRIFSVQLFILALAIPAFSAPRAYGAEEVTGLQEVVVTARKREENLQEIPLSVTAFSSDEIARAGFENLEDISKHTPGLQFNNTLSGFRPGRLFSNMRFRGVEGSQFASLSTASLFIDGVYALQAAQSLALTDLERVEVIKGPQSAIFGRNSFAGAVNYVTRTPSLTQSSGKVSVDVAQYNQYEVSASYEGPAIENKLAYRIGFRSFQKGSMYTATDGGALGEQTSRSVFATLYGKPTDQLTMRLRAYYQVDDDGPEAAALMYFAGPGAAQDTCTGTSYRGYDPQGNLTTLYPREYLCGKIPNPGQAGAPRVDYNTGLRPNFSSFSGANADFLINNLLHAGRIGGVPNLNSLGLKRDILRVNLVSDYTFENDITLTGTLAYNDNKAANIRDFDVTPVEAWWVTNPQAGTDKSVEIRVTSPSKGRFRWLGGVNYYKQKFLTSANAGVLVHACGNFAGIATGNFCSSPGLFPVGIDGGDFVKQGSVYGSASFDFTDKWTIDLEARYQEDNRSDGVTTFDKTYYSVIPRVTLTFKPTDKITIYALGTQGVLPGVINANFLACNNTPYTSPFLDPQTGALSTLSVCDQYKKQLGAGAKGYTNQQTLDALELGVKTTWLDGRMIANLSLYQQKWNDQPSTQGVTAYQDDRTDPATGQVAGDGIPNLTPNFYSVSVSGNSKYEGAELETAFEATHNWTINMNLSYNKNEFSSFFTAPEDGIKTECGTNNFKGKQNARFPAWSGGLSSTYQRHAFGEWSAYARGDVTYTGEAPADQCNRAWIQSYFLTNVRVGLEKDALRAELYVKNLFDEDSWVTGNDFSNFTIRSPTGIDFGHGGIILIPQDKRSVGIKFSYDF